MKQEMMRVEVPVPLDDVGDALCALSHKALLILMLKVDLQVADVGFTEELVKGLVKSLKADRADVEIDYIDWDKV